MAKAKHYPTPHSEAWFEELLRRDPRRFGQTRAIIDIAGGDTEICGICGDKPAFDYRLTKPKWWKGWPMRLCPDCREIREHQWEEPLAILPDPVPPEGTEGCPCPVCKGPTHWVTFAFCCHRCQLTVGDAWHVSGAYAQEADG